MNRRPSSSAFSRAAPVSCIAADAPRSDTTSPSAREILLRLREPRPPESSGTFGRSISPATPRSSSAAIAELVRLFEDRSSSSTPGSRASRRQSASASSGGLAGWPGAATLAARVVMNVRRSVCMDAPFPRIIGGRSPGVGYLSFLSLPPKSALKLCRTLLAPFDRAFPVDCRPRLSTRPVDRDRRLKTADHRLYPDYTCTPMPPKNLLRSLVIVGALLGIRVAAVTRLASADGQFWDIQDTSPWAQDSGGIATGGRANPFNGFGYLKIQVRAGGPAAQSALVRTEYLRGFGLAHDGGGAVRLDHAGARPAASSLRAGSTRRRTRTISAISTASPTRRGPRARSTSPGAARPARSRTAGK